MKIKFYTNGNTIYGVGKTALGNIYRARATCSPEDIFDLEKGKEIVRLRLKMKQQVKIFTNQTDKLFHLQDLTDLMRRKRSKTSTKYYKMSQKLDELIY